jgi:chromosome partitioning protein
MKNLIFFNTKGGCSKSTLCHYTGNEIQRLGYTVSIQNTDQQVHVTVNNDDKADYFLYDTAGAFTASNNQLLQAASSDNNTIVIIPIGTGVNDLKEVDFLVSNINKYNLQQKTWFVFTKERANSKALAEGKQELRAKGLNVLKWVMPNLTDFGAKRNTPRTRKEISQFINEVF